MVHVMAGPHPWDHTSLEAPPADYPARLAEGVAGLKVAFSADLGHARVDPEVASLVADAVRGFDDLGCAVEPVTPDFGPDGPDLIRVFWPAHLLNFSYLVAEWEDRMDPGLLACIRAGQGFSAQDYLDARARKLAYIERVHRFFEDWDLLLTPAVSVAAVPGRATSTGALAEPRVGLDHVGRVLLSLQLLRQPGGECALRLHGRRPAGRPSDRRPALRRSDRAARRQRRSKSRAPGAVRGRPFETFHRIRRYDRSRGGFCCKTIFGPLGRNIDSFDGHFGQERFVAETVSILSLRQGGRGQSFATVSA